MTNYVDDRGRNHLYERDGVLHGCRGGNAAANDPGTYLVWTGCGIDVPANGSFKSRESVTCPACLEPSQHG